MTESDFVVVHTAPTHQDAQLVAGLLEAEGIRTMLPGSGLADEFGMSQKLGSQDVVVLRSDAERASDIVAAWKEAPGGEPGGESGGQ